MIGSAAASNDNMLVFLKATGALIVLFNTPFFYTMLWWLMFILDGAISTVFLILGFRNNLTEMISYNYLIKRQAIPVAHYGDHAYAYKKIAKLGLFGLVTGLGCLGLFTPESVRI